MIIMEPDQARMGGGTHLLVGSWKQDEESRGKDTCVEAKFSFPASILAHSAAFSWSCIMRR